MHCYIVPWYIYLYHKSATEKTNIEKKSLNSLQQH